MKVPALMNPSMLHIVSTRKRRRRKARNLSQTQEGDTGVVNNVYSSISNYDARSGNKQHNHVKVAIHEAAQLLELPCADLQTYPSEQVQNLKRSLVKLSINCYLVRKTHQHQTINET